MSTETIVEIGLVKNWRPLAFRGVIGLAFGAAALLLPVITLTALILLFGAYLLADGIAALVAGLEHRVPAVLWLMEGIVGIGVGAAALIWPGPTTVVIVDLIAFWAIITGAIELSAAARIRKHLKGERSLAFAGLFSLALGTLMIVWPVLSAVAIITFLGCYAMFFGITMLVLAARVHKHHATPRETRRHLEHRTA